MASIERSSRARRRNKSLKMKTPSSSTSLVTKASKISSSSKAIEAERIITRDGFGYFPMVND
jgi:hypothetical protein